MDYFFSRFALLELYEKVVAGAGFAWYRQRKNVFVTRSSELIRSEAGPQNVLLRLSNLQWMSILEAVDSFEGLSKYC